MNRILSIVTLVISMVVSVSATTINIPADYPTIQEGFDASVDGDTVLVAPGIYYENLILEKEIVFASHAIYDDLGSDWLNNENITGTIISGAQEPSDPNNGSCLIVRGGGLGYSGNPQPEIIGLTFQDGDGTSMTLDNCGSPSQIRAGGAILMYKAYPTIMYNRFINNGHDNDNLRAGRGGRIGGAMGHFADDGVEFDEDRSSSSWNNNRSNKTIGKYISSRNNNRSNETIGEYISIKNNNRSNKTIQDHIFANPDDVDAYINGINTQKIQDSKPSIDPSSFTELEELQTAARDTDFIPGDGLRGDLDIHLYDSYGDGWQGNTLNIGGYVFGLASGSYAYHSLTLDDGVYPVTCGGGTWQSEVSWEIVDAADGSVLLSGGAPYEGGLVIGGPGVPDVLNITNNYFENNSSGDGENFYSYGYEGSIDVSNSIFEDIDCETNKVNDFVLQSIEDDADFVQNDISGNCIESSTFYVSSTGDDSNDGTESDPFKTIGQALTLVRDGETVTTINLASGTYSPTTGEKFPIVLPDKVHLIGDGSETTILDAEADAESEAAVMIIKEVENVRVANLTLTGGYSEGHGCTGGGGILLTADDMFNFGDDIEGDPSVPSNPLIENVIIEDNHSHNGGGLSFFRMSGPVLNNVIIRNNTATAFGGGVFSYCSTTDMTDVTITENQNQGVGQGGGIMLAASSGTYDNMTITYNTAVGSHGGGIWTNDSGGAGNWSDGWTMTNSTISGNTGHWFGGGILFAWSHPTLINCTISDNTSGWGGGGIMGLESGFTIKESMVSDNFTGGIFVWGPLYGIEGPVIQDCLVAGNQTTGDAAGIFLQDDVDATITRTYVVDNYASGYVSGIGVLGSSATLDKVTVSGNSSGAGGSLGGGNAATVDMTNSIFWNNTGDDSWEEFVAIGFLNVTYSNIEGGVSGAGNIDADPLFTDLDNGDYTLQPESPCIDAGSADLDGDGTDDIGYAGDAPDMGAFELGGILGCNDPEAENYDPGANMNDGTCIYGPPMFAYNTGWNIVGLPFDVENAMYEILFPTAQEGTLFQFYGTYVNRDELIPGTGYLLRLTSEDTVTFTGTHIYGLNIPVLEGWNLISGISSTLSVDDVYAHDIIYSGTVYGLDANYYNPESIEPGRGYWVRATEDGEITLGSPPANVEFMMTIVLDNYPGETSWDLFGPEGEVASGGPYSDAGGTVEFSEILSLNGDYVWTIYDDWGDGICCSYGNGSYELMLNGEVIATGGNFGGSESVNFTVGARNYVSSLITTRLPDGVEYPDVKGDTPFVGNIDFITETIEYDVVNSIGSAKQASILKRLESSNSITFSSGKYSTELYFGVEIPEDEILSYSLPPTLPDMAFDARFSGDTKLVPESGVIELITNSEMITIEYEITVDAGRRHTWVLRSESGKDYTLEGAGEITIPSEERFVLNKETVIPSTFTLHQNFPNPFNPTTTLRYDLPSDAFVTLSIYDMLGREITKLVNTTQQAGFKSIQWNAKDSFGKSVSAGVYLYQIEAGDFVQTRKMVLLK